MLLKKHISIGALLLFLMPLHGFPHGGGNEGGEDGIDEQSLFFPNEGQWHEAVRFRSRLSAGRFFLEDQGFTYLLVDQGKLHDLQHELAGKEAMKEKSSMLDAHAVKVRLLGSEDDPAFHREGRADYYENYYRGKDPDGWAEKLHPYEEVRMEGVYSGIDLEFQRNKSGIKYSFHVEEGADPSSIRLDYKGHEALEVTDEGDLRISTSLGPVIEKAPRAFQPTSTGEKEVPCRFVLEGDELRFEFPEGYDEGRSLLIDPDVIFASYTGSTVDNWGNTATYDDSGAFYGGGTAFGQGYPTSTGAYQMNFGGGGGGLGCDVAISKFTPDGSSLIYSTYLGGSDNELPHSLVVNDQGELFVLGSTGSSDFPTDSNAVEPNFLGGSNGTAFGAIDFNNGTDAFLSKFSADGTSLPASTYLGGSDNDGLNEAGNLNFNYGDILRGEVVVDGSGDPYVVSTTRSSDLPTTSGVPQPNLAGGQDAFVTKLTSDLSTIQFCSYYGGSDHDAGYAIELGGAQGIYICGGTESNDLPVPQGWQTNPQGGVDGFVTRFDNGMSTVQDASYIGTADYDQSYFLDRDTSDNIFLYGQSNGTYPVLNAGYSDPNSGQFIQKLPPDLSSSLLSTVFGTGSGNTDISPSAFMVSNCNNIYLAGWGGSVNQGHGVSSSTTNGLPTTGNAFQSSTDGSDFYLMVLGEDANSLKYGSFFGGGVSAEHVDGGTSRFDEEGVVYQAVCGGCGGNNDFPTTSDAHSQTNNSSNCNLAAIKFDMSQLVAGIDLQNPPVVCEPDTFDFDFDGSGGTKYYWDFGDGTVDSGSSVSHFYNDTGSYQITLIVEDTLSCKQTDTATTMIHILEPTPAYVDSVPPLCPGDSVQMNAGGGYSYQWTPNDSVSDPTIEDPIVYPDSTTEYQVVIDGCASDSTVITDTVKTTVEIADIISYAHGDSAICPGDSTAIHAEHGVGHAWTPSSSLDDSTLASPTVFPQDSTWYTVSITDSNGCENQDSVLITLHDEPQLDPRDTSVCEYDSVVLQPNGPPGNYQWDPPTGLDDPGIKNPMATGIDSTEYLVSVTDSLGCTGVDTLQLDVTDPPPISSSPDTTVCQGDSAELWVTGGVQQSWTPASSMDDNSSDQPTVFPDSSTLYQVSITNAQGCRNFDSVLVEVSDPSITSEPDTFICRGDSVQLSASGGSSYDWSPASSLNDPNVSDPMASPSQTTTYQVTGVDSYGCEATATLLVQVDTSLPNAQAGPDTTICKGDEISLSASGGHEYEWSPSTGLSDPGSSSPLASPTSDTEYQVVVTNGCGTDRDTAHLQVQKPESNAGPDTTLCEGEKVSLYAEGGVSYEWSPAEPLDDPNSAEPTAWLEGDIPFQVVVTDSLGCTDTGEAHVGIFDDPELSAGEDMKVDWGQKVELSAEGDEGTFSWYPESFFENPSSRTVSFHPKDHGTFRVELVDTNGCTAVDSLDIMVSGSLYAPNAFTPDGDGTNDEWRVKGEEIEDFHLRIYDRWGEKVFETEDIDDAWDGRVKGHPAKPDVYVYVIEYSETYRPEEIKEKVGHITLIR